MDSRKRGSRDSDVRMGRVLIVGIQQVNCRYSTGVQLTYNSVVLQGEVMFSM